MQHETYQLEFQQALDKSFRWKALHKSWLDMPAGLPAAIDALPEVRKLVERMPFDEKIIRTNCGGIHFSLYHQLGERFPSFLTIGDVEVDGIPKYSTSNQYLKREINGANNLTDNNFNAHVWLTFPDMHIIDVTFLTILFRDQMPVDPSWKDLVICSCDSSSSNLPLKYRPMLISPETVERLVFG